MASEDKFTKLVKFLKRELPWISIFNIEYLWKLAFAVALIMSPNQLNLKFQGNTEFICETYCDEVILTTNVFLNHK